jgi:N-glycosylase/DNA lyase
MVQSLCNHYSPALLTMPDPSNPSEHYTYHPFPPPSALTAPSVNTTLRSLGFGYRADFIHKTAKMLVESHGSSPLSADLREPSEIWLHTLRSEDTAKAREELLKFVGVGRKVADCVLLMSMDKVRLKFAHVFQRSSSLKKEVIPVDTHVHQIAVKHYGLGGSSGKLTMTPKIYDQVNGKLQSLWGDYAGWAHSVSLVFAPLRRSDFLLALQVLFTADLKIFANYGTDSPVKTPVSRSAIKRTKTSDDTLPTISRTAAPSPSPIKRAAEAIEALDLEDSASLAERIKRRRRNGAK